MMGMGNNTLRGSQTFFHGLRMWAQMFRVALFVAAAAVVAVPCWNVYRNTTGYEWYAAGMYTLAKAKLTIGYARGSLQEVDDPHGVPKVLTLGYLATWRWAWEVRERLRDEIYAGAFLGLQAGLGGIAVFLAAFWVRGRGLTQKRRIRGAELATARQLRRRVLPVGARALRLLAPSAGRPYEIAGVPYPERAETQHTIVSGTTGSGKTVLISDLVAQIRSEGRALRDLRQDGQLHAILLRSRTRRAAEPARCARAALVAVPGGPQSARLRHHGRRADPPAAGYRRSVLGHRRAAIVRQRRGRPVETRRHREPHPGRSSAEDRSHGPGRGDGGHGGPVHRRSRESEDRALACAPC